MKPLKRQLNPGDLVAIKDDHPGLGLRAGDIGVVIFVYGEGSYEVNFTDEKGEWGNVWLEEELAEPEDDT